MSLATRPLRRVLLMFFLFAIPVSIDGCATLRGHQASSDPVGQYSYTSTAHGQPVNGTITIARAQDRYTIVLNTGGMTRDILFTDVTANGSSLTAATQAANGTRFAVHLTVDGNAISGDWTLGEQGAPLRGTRVSGAK